MIAVELALLMGAAVAAAWLGERVKLPGVIGALGAGVITAQLLLPHLPPGLPGPTLDAVSPHLRMAVLAVVLLRVGFSLTPGDLRGAGGLAVGLGLLPMAGDALAAAELEGPPEAVAGVRAALAEEAGEEKEDEKQEEAEKDEHKRRRIPPLLQLYPPPPHHQQQQHHHHHHNFLHHDRPH